MMLTMEGVHAHYGHIHALRGIDVEVQVGEIVTLIGANGAGKSTLMMSLFGSPKASAGRIVFDGEDITGVHTHEIARRGIALVPEGRRIFPRMTVIENLQMGTAHADPANYAADIARVFAMFPILEERQSQRAGTLSGGEQQMLAIGRALIARPRLMLLDEPSLGLSPLLVENIFTIISRINAEQGVSMLLVEQNAAVALAIAHYGYIMETGKVVIDGSADKLAADADVREFYLGMGGAGSHKSYRELKHYKRRKRWLS